MDEACFITLKLYVAKAHCHLLCLIVSLRMAWNHAVVCDREDLGSTTTFFTSSYTWSPIIMQGIYSSDFTQRKPCFVWFLHCLTNTLCLSASVSSEQRKSLGSAFRGPFAAFFILLLPYLRTSKCPTASPCLKFKMSEPVKLQDHEPSLHPGYWLLITSNTRLLE